MPNGDGVGRAGTAPNRAALPAGEGLRQPGHPAVVSLCRGVGQMGQGGGKVGAGMGVGMEWGRGEDGSGVGVGWGWGSLEQGWDGAGRDMMGQGRVGHNGMRTDVTGWGQDVTGAGMSRDEDEGWDGMGVCRGTG